ncbi:MAG TPA: portal protein, partial [Nitrospira sp.]|nr:portal protein [Nitrospira sp.]
MQEEDGTYSADSTASSPSDDSEQADHSELIKLAVDRFKQAYDAHKDDFEQCERVQEFISGDQWPTAIKAERERLGRPCLTLDLLTQYVRHVINTGLLRYRDIRVLAMDGMADDEVADIIAGIIRQITQTSTAKVAYETGLRHSCSVGFGYWRVRVQNVAGSPLEEIVIHKIREPRMVFLDPHCLYPDGRDARYAFVLTKMQRSEFKEQYPGHENATSWHDVHEQSILPWTGDDVIVLAEYYYTKTYTDEMGQEKSGLFFTIMTPEYVLEEGKHHGDAMPIIRVVGDEYEGKGKERKRGMINASSMDAQRTFNYANSAFIENVALAPIAPWVAAAKQVDQHVKEWEEAHRVPRSVLTYDPIIVNGTLLPPPTRSMPAGIPQ